MIDAEKVLLANLTEALRQVQRYVVIGLWTGISALALTPGSGMLPDELNSATPLGSPLPLDPTTARLLLLGTCVIVGAMAAYAAETANRIVAELSYDQGLLTAVRLFPGFPTSPYPVVRLGAAALPAIFSLAAVLMGAVRTTNINSFGIWMALVVIAAPYIALGLELRRPIGLLERSGAVAPAA